MSPLSRLGPFTYNIRFCYLYGKSIFINSFIMYECLIRGCILVLMNEILHQVYTYSLRKMMKGQRQEEGTILFSVQLCIQLDLMVRFN